MRTLLLLTTACLPHNTAIKHKTDTPVNLRIIEGKMRVYLADKPLAITGASLVINQAGSWTELDDSNTSEKVGQLLIANNPLTLSANVTFKDHHQNHTCASKDLPLASLITGKDSSLTHDNCQHSSESPKIIYATFDYLGANLAKFNLFREIKEISCTISYNNKSRTLELDTIDGLSRRVTSHYFFTKEGDDKKFALRCSLISNLLPKLTRNSQKVEVLSSDKICVKFGKGMGRILGDHFEIKVADHCPRNNFDLVMSFSEQMPASPEFVTRNFSSPNTQDKLKNIKMLVQCPDGCLPVTTHELICKIDRGKKPKKCFDFYLKQESAFYGEFALCDRTKVGEIERKDFYLRCKSTGNDWVELQLTSEMLTKGKVCVATTGTDIKHVVDGNCSSKAVISFFK